MTTPAILFVESNTTGTGLRFLEVARELGFVPLLATSNAIRYDLTLLACANLVRLSSSQPGEILDWVAKSRSSFSVAAVWSSSEYHVECAAEVASRLGLPGPRYEAIRAVRDKAYQRARSESLHTYPPRWVTVSSAADALSFFERLGPPIVLKPAFGSGSVDVRLCRSASDITKYFAAVPATADRSAGPAILAEEFISGDEYSVELFDGTVIGITKKHVGEPPCFVEVGHDFPAVLPERDERRLRAFAETIARTFDLCWGPVHLEAKIDERQCTLIEINPRLAGGHIPSIVLEATGVDLVRATLQRLLGISVELAQTRSGYSSIRFLVSPPAHRHSTVDMLAVQAIENVVSVKTYPRRSEPGLCHGDFRDRNGHVIATGMTGDLASAAASAAIASMTTQNR